MNAGLHTGGDPSALERAALLWQLEQGADVPLADGPRNLLESQKTERDRDPEEEKASPVLVPQTQPSLTVSSAETAHKGRVATSPAPDLGVEQAQKLEQALSLAGAAQTRESLQQAIETFEGIQIKRHATKMVFSDGFPVAPIMLVGEAPGGDEDRIGRPFVGVSGQLLDRMLAAIERDRTREDPDQAVYISNILNWRPPGNRTPTPEEVTLSRPFIERHIALVRPRLLVLVGGVAASALLRTSESVTRLRAAGERAYTPAHPELFGGEKIEIPCFVTYHPSYLLRTPIKKREAWSDWLKIQNKLREF